MAHQTMSIDELVRSIGVRSDTPHAMLLGAGASLSSGVPSAMQCVWEWKKALFTTNNPGSENDVAELTLDSVKRRIDSWLDQQGLQPADGVDEYGYFIEKCHPVVGDRNAYFAKLIRGVQPHVGYALLAQLASQELVTSIWSTNFDGLAAKAIGETDVTPIEIGVDCKERAIRSRSKSEVLCVSLHGDFRYDHLKNTPDELQEQEAELIAAFAQRLSGESLIVCGYSGRDESLMRALETAYESDGVGRLYWCDYSHEIRPSVEALLVKASLNGREAIFIPGVSFDDLMMRLARHCFSDASRKKASALLEIAESDERSQRKKFALPGGATRKTKALKSNSWLIQCPSEVFDFDILKWPESQVWSWLAKRTERTGVEAVPLRGRVVALGTADEIRQVFSDMKGDLKRVPISERDFTFEDGAIVKLMRRAIVQSLSKTNSLESDGDRTVWQSHRFSRQGCSFELSKAARLSLRDVAGETVICIDPTVHVHAPAETPREVIGVQRNTVLGYQHNSEYNADINMWWETLFSRGTETVIEFPVESAAFEFRVAAAPCCVNILDVVNSKGHSASGGVGAATPFAKGVEIGEPKLRFGVKAGERHLDTLPLRGIANGKPFDVSLNDTFGQGDLRVAVVCPKAESAPLRSFLQHANAELESPRGDKEEYMPPYRGFESLFGARLRVAKPGYPSWRDLPDVQSEGEVEGTRELARNIVAEIDAIASTDNSVVLIVTPDRWSRFRRYETESESFDVHDYVKAHCVRRGIATQFLDQQTFADRNPCRVWWWLSLAIYAKSRRTPWVLDTDEQGTSFVGLGYSVDRYAEKGKKIVLGCSHIYSSNGQGMQFRLSKIDDPMWIGRNPFLKHDEARRLGETIRTLFWESHNGLPERVVLHKQTKFLRQEREGLLAGLEGVKHVDMVEVNYESSLRLINSEVKRRQLTDSRWPIRRGTLVQLGDYEALLYVHGATDAKNPGWTYFQGKRRIPGPIIIRRHAGQTDLSVLASEILGLSKMDWNSGDLYGKLPATIHSSGVVAKIARLLERFDGYSYDYRLFM